ncbi:MAG: aspartate 1-decarboxylase [Deltaproteobacteria bacterium RIFCSPLOWO2_02_FULL_50_16]|nr:MAG: aspartate 1-decarboxylase [Deltaproteobacteria bacterium GWA2_50_8]OGQ57664.1 MAG: aspartate 1-decarboxylase [Deltaproteobacteria bacterium RIFCSPLOWO2_02_FULL_50_16]OGQ67879.1 MAG: aspartate 1-decarboxylase [Deltaproteobacteria bacterium RIFCSPLOWO2_12_FULL_50_11]
MQRSLLKSKIHRATVTQADLDYEGSISIDEDLMKAANLITHEHVHVWNITQGTRFETYVIPAPAGSGMIQINGAAAHLAKKADKVIITSFTTLPARKIKRHKPKIVFVNDANKITRIANTSGMGPYRQ